MLINFSGNVWVSSAYAILAGMLLGAFYFAGLWWTVKRLGSSRIVAPMFLFSLVFRVSVVVLGFYFILGKEWPHLLLGLLGFMILRLFATRLIQLKDSPVLIDPVLTLRDKHSQAEDNQ